jgi:DNA (cytosine-5)-methyltransferase 1
MKHLDLFSGIGGFSVAVDEIWPDAEHTFCEIDPFCRAVLKKHWPESKIYGDIRTLTNTEYNGFSPAERQQETSRLEQRARRAEEQKGSIESSRGDTRPFLLTGGFPCQPFSHAGRRKGTSDDRHLWPEMFRVIREFSPRWVVGENVRGLLNIEGGLVFEQVCLDLESIGYEVQPFIIPACAVNAPHRRDRIWIVAHRHESGLEGRYKSEYRGGKSEASSRFGDSDAENSFSLRGGGGMEDSGQVLGSGSTETEDARSSWARNWVEVATELCSLDDGLPAQMGDTTISKSRHRVEQLKAYGNAIVPQVAVEIMKAIRLYETQNVPPNHD